MSSERRDGSDPHADKMQKEFPLTEEEHTRANGIRAKEVSKHLNFIDERITDPTTLKAFGELVDALYALNDIYNPARKAESSSRAELTESLSKAREHAEALMGTLDIDMTHGTISINGDYIGGFTPSTYNQFTGTLEGL